MRVPRVVPLLAAALLAAHALPAQRVVVAGTRAVTAQVEARLVIPPRLRVRDDAPVRVAARGDTVTWVLPVAVAANIDWTLRIAAGDADGVRQALRVRDVNGAWCALEDGPVTVVEAAPAVHDRPVRVELQVIRPAGARAPRNVTLEVLPAGR